MNNELTLEVKCFSLLCMCAYSYVFNLALHLDPHRLQHICVCVMEYKCVEAVELGVAVSSY